MTRTHHLVAPLLLLAGGCDGEPVDLDVPALTCGNRNLLLNGDFEAGSDTLPDEWRATAGPYVDFHWDQDVAHAGLASGSIEINPDHPPTPSDYGWYQDVRVVASADEPCELRGWIRTRDLKESAWMRISLLDPVTIPMGPDFTRELDVRGTSDWTAVKVSFTAPPGAKIRVLVGVSGRANAGGQVWFDDLEVSAPPSG